MNTELNTANPFALMLDPAQVLRSMQQSQSLRRLHQHRHSPLDKPLIPLRSAEEARAAADKAAAQRSVRASDAGSLSLRALKRQVPSRLN